MVFKNGIIFDQRQVKTLLSPKTRNAQIPVNQFFSQSWLANVGLDVQTTVQHSQISNVTSQTCQYYHHSLSLLPSTSFPYAPPSGLEKQNVE